MSKYRIYMLDVRGRITSKDDYVCSDDRAAQILAASFLPYHPQVEIWLDTRLVGSMSAPPRSMNRADASAGGASGAPLQDR